MISIITITYKDFIGLEDTLKSINDQDYNDFEHLIIDGGEDALFIRNLKSFNPKSKLISEKDNGIYDAMNKGGFLANGDYILYMNSGDTFYDNKSLGVLASNIKMGDIIVGAYQAKYGKTYKYSRFINKPLDFSRGMPFCTQSALISKNTFLSINGFSTEYKILSDWLFFWTCSDNKLEFIILDEIISIFDKSGVSSKGNLNRLFKEKRTILKIKNKSTTLLFIQYLKSIIKSFMPSKILHIYRR